MSLKVEPEIYPNGKKYLSFSFNGKHMGNADILDDGRILVFGKRKSKSNFYEAAIQMAYDHMKKAEKEADMWMEIHNNLL